ncbi:hypothetical protein [Komagataeibacter saccharivorans]|uniref:hypothetical protein n=1 Tax=Komagataeibacter saccharivorans TaxID=265959 RepID=UPI0024A7FC42|nr:hypothetical protein [Komagataeibacter saccharivorans]
MPLFSGQRAPDFEATTTAGRIGFHDWLGPAWGVLVTHPEDFRPTVTPLAGLPDGAVKLLFLSSTPISEHVHPIAAGQFHTGATVCLPDEAQAIRALYAGDTGDEWDAPVEEHSVFFIAPDRTVRSRVSYPPSTGQDLGEIIGLLDVFRTGTVSVMRNDARMAAA